MHLARFCIFFSGTYYVSRWLLIAKWITICFDNHLLPGESDTTVVVWFGNWIAKLGFLTEEENTQKKKTHQCMSCPGRAGAARRQTNFAFASKLRHAKRRGLLIASPGTVKNGARNIPPSRRLCSICTQQADADDSFPSSSKAEEKKKEKGQPDRICRCVDVSPVFASIEGTIAMRLCRLESTLVRFVQTE
jgi:hypothetical protein